MRAKKSEIHSSLIYAIGRRVAAVHPEYLFWPWKILRLSS
jgi:hypothetical protein